MAQMSYIFGDLRTGQIIEEINSLYGVSMTDKFGGGDFRATFNLDQTGKDNDTLMAATIPGRCYVVVEREGVTVWSGMVWTRTYQSQAKSTQLYCRAFENYPERRLIRSNLSYTNMEQRNIVRNLFLDMQTDPNSITVDIPSSFSTLVTKSVTVLASEYKTYKQVIDSVANAADGFDWRITVARQGGVYVRQLSMGYPYLGGTNPNNLIFEYPGAITNYWENETMGEGATNVYGIGAGEGDDMLQASYVHQDLLNFGFPRFDLDVSFKDIENQSRLNALTAQQAAIRRAPMPVITAELKGDSIPVFGGYAVGDACTIIIKDPKHPNVLKKQSRLYAWEYYPSSDDSVEMARLNFEGEDIVS